MRRRLFFLALGLTALVGVYGVSGPVWLRVQARWHLGRLGSEDPRTFERAYAALAREMDPQVAFVLCDEVERGVSKQVYYQVVRIIHERCGAPFAPEDVALPGPAVLRRMVKERYERKS